jgi:hypothetical protein
MFTLFVLNGAKSFYQRAILSTTVLPNTWRRSAYIFEKPHAYCIYWMNCSGWMKSHPCGNLMKSHFNEKPLQ